MESEQPGLGAEEALRVTLQALPEVAAGLKRGGVPTELQFLFTAASLGPRHIPVLSYLLMDGPMTVGELAARLNLSMPTTSLMVGQLSQHGIAERGRDPGDRRRVLVRIADVHRPLVQSWLDQRAEPIRRALARLSPAQRRVFCEGLRMLAEEFTTTVEDRG